MAQEPENAGSVAVRKLLEDVRNDLKLQSLFQVRPELVCDDRIAVLMGKGIVRHFYDLLTVFAVDFFLCVHYTISRTIKQVLN